MHIQLKLFATLGAYAPADCEHFAIAPGATVADIIRQLGIPSREAKLIFVNGVKRNPEAPLANGDRLGIFPPVGGG
jgi:molybdopterin synthase sulfur carrier subunit